MDIGNLNSFLQLGHFMKYRCPEMDQFDFSELDRQKYNDTDESVLLDEMEQTFFKSIQAHFKSDQKHLIPLSGGLDSRALLAALLEFTDVKNISTYTFGVPKTFDYEIGNSIARECGTNHTSYCLDDYPYSIDYLIEMSQLLENQTLLFFHPPYKAIENKYQNHHVWSGWLADFLAGFQCLTATNPFHTKEIAMEWYIAFCKMVRSTSLINGDESSYSHYWTWNTEYEDKMRWDDQLVLYNRQCKYTRPQLLVGDLNYVTPFLDPLYYNFFLSLPDRYRHNQYLYKKYLYKRFPKLFNIPTKKNLNLPINYGSILINLKKYYIKMIKLGNRLTPKIVDPTLNYMDFKHKLRYDNNFRTLIHRLLIDLMARKILDWLDIRSIWEEHQKKMSNHTYAILTLASLEVHLKAGLDL